MQTQFRQMRFCDITPRYIVQIVGYLQEVAFNTFVTTFFQKASIYCIRLKKTHLGNSYAEVLTE